MYIVVTHKMYKIWNKMDTNFEINTSMYSSGSKSSKIMVEYIFILKNVAAGPTYPNKFVIKY